MFVCDTIVTPAISALAIDRGSQRDSHPPDHFWNTFASGNVKNQLPNTGQRQRPCALRSRSSANPRLGSGSLEKNERWLTRYLYPPASCVR